jgi:ferredoxin
MPKLAALLAAAKLPEPEPVATVTYKSAGPPAGDRPARSSRALCRGRGDALDVTIFSRGGSGAQERKYPVVGGRIDSLTGWLGAFKLNGRRTTPIDLDLCTRCNACVAACPEGAIGLDYQINLQACTSHRDCVRACDVAGAIDFAREPVAHTDSFDLVLDLRQQPGFTAARAAARLFPPAAGQENGPRRAGRRAQAARAGRRIREAEVLRVQAEALRPQPQRTGRLQRLHRGLFGRSHLQRQGAPADQGQSQPVRRLRRLHHGLPDRRADLCLPARGRAGRARSRRCSPPTKRPADPRPCCCSTARKRPGAGRAARAARAPASCKACRPT